MVDTPGEPLPRGSILPSVPQHLSHNGRFPRRMGSALGCFLGRGQMANIDQTSTHQCAGALCHLLSSDFISSAAEGQGSFGSHGQFYSSVLHKQTGRDCISIPLSTGASDVDLVSTPRHISGSNTRSRSTERLGRFPQSRRRTPPRLGTELEISQTVVPSLGSATNRCLCLPRQCQVPTILLQGGARIRPPSGTVSSSLGNTSTYTFPPQFHQ